MYDIYLFAGSHHLPDLEDLGELFPALADTELHVKLLQRSPGPHFLGLDMPADIARSFLKRLREANAVGYLLPSAYRCPCLTREQALPFAAQALQDLLTKRFPDNTPHRDTVALHSIVQQPFCWTFRADIPTGKRTARVFVHIDKLDGHVWTRTERLRIWNESFFFGEREQGKIILPRASWAEHYEMYDIYLFMGCYALPDLNDLSHRAAILTHPSLQTKMLDRSSHSGFLGLDLPLEIVVDLSDRLRDEGARGYWLPSAYQEPYITSEEAFLVARQAIGEQRAPGDTLGPVRFVREQPVCWTFGASSAQLVKKDCIPGMVFASVDKIDGHAWQPEEFDRLFGEE